MKRKTKVLIIIMFVIITATFLSGCIPGDGRNSPENKAGFLWGVWHGWLAPVSLIVSFFKENISIYEINNTGWLYDFGYYIAVISGFGGLAISRKKRVKRVRDYD